MHALIENNVITALRDAPAGGAWEDGEWLDFTDPATLAAWEERHGWVPVTETPRPKDTDTTKHDESVRLIDGIPTQWWKARPWNAEEVGERDDRLARAADRAAVRALVAGINASIDEAKAAKVAAQAVLDAVAPTTVPQTWTRVKDLARAVRDTDNALIGAEQGVKAVAKYLKEL
jgi:hypothetical protein